MPESRELGSVIDAATHAADSGDYASAEKLLREAALQQEADFGPLHPDLANTLNNLGVIYEITDKLADAERCYRKAYAIATAALEPDHPFVATSRQNLKDFCKARGIPVESTTPPPADAAEQQPRIVNSAPPPHVGRKSSLSLRVGALSLCGLVVVMLVVTRPWSRSNTQAGASTISTTESLPGSPAPTPAPVEPIAAPKEITTNNRVPVKPASSRARAASVPAPPTLASAQLCRGLSTGGSRGSAGDWRCAAARSPVDSGSLIFYTRLKSANDTTVQHRWYRASRLYQAVDLRIRANQSSGYRTYSRYNMNTGSAGNWRVEVRSRDGVLLHEERFVVR